MSTVQLALLQRRCVGFSIIWGMATTTAPSFFEWSTRPFGSQSLGSPRCNNQFYYVANPVRGNSLCADWFFLGQDFAVQTVSMETV